MNVPDRARVLKLDEPPLAGRMAGNGEAAWVSAGRVLCTASLGSHPKAFETYTRHLLGECAPDQVASADRARE
jgi:hypothetical protein